MCLLFSPDLFLFSVQNCVKGHFGTVKNDLITLTLTRYETFYPAQPLLCLSAENVTTFTFFIMERAIKVTLATPASFHAELLKSRWRFISLSGRISPFPFVGDDWAIFCEASCKHRFSNATHRFPSVTQSNGRGSRSTFSSTLRKFNGSHSDFRESSFL